MSLQQAVEYLRYHMSNKYVVTSATSCYIYIKGKELLLFSPQQISILAVWITYKQVFFSAQYSKELQCVSYLQHDSLVDSKLCNDVGK